MLLRFIFCSLLLIFLLCNLAISEELSIVIVGDMMFGAELAQIMDREGSLAPFAGVIDTLKSADITFGVLEGVISERGEKDLNKAVTYRSKPSTARGLSNAGFDIISLATPHILDYGKEGFLDTLEFLSWYGIKYVGAGRNLREAKQPIIIDAKGTKIAFLAYYRGFQFDKTFFAKEDQIGPAFPVFEDLEKDVSNAKAQSDFVIAFIHWGARTNGSEVTERQRLYAQKLIDSGVDFVIGQKLNILQGVEIYNGKPIFYSLGDFIYGTYAKKEPYGFMLRLIISDKKLIRTEVIPISISDAISGSFLPEHIEGQKVQDAINVLNKLSEEFGTTIIIKDNFGVIEQKEN